MKYDAMKSKKSKYIWMIVIEVIVIILIKIIIMVDASIH